MDKQTDRKQNFMSMYKLDQDSTPDYYDSVKIALDQIKTKRNERPFVDMKKQTKRDFGKLWQGNDAYKNIQLENARQEYIKNLLDEV